MEISQQSALGTFAAAGLAGILGGHGMDVHTSQMVAGGILAVGGWLVHHHGKAELVAAGKQVVQQAAPVAITLVESKLPAQDSTQAVSPVVPAA